MTLQLILVVIYNAVKPVNSHMCYYIVCYMCQMVTWYSIYQQLVQLSNQPNIYKFHCALRPDGDCYIYTGSTAYNIQDFQIQVDFCPVTIHGYNTVEATDYEKLDVDVPEGWFIHVYNTFTVLNSSQTQLLIKKWPYLLISYSKHSEQTTVYVFIILFNIKFTQGCAKHCLFRHFLLYPN